MNSAWRPNAFLKNIAHDNQWIWCWIDKSCKLWSFWSSPSEHDVLQYVCIVIVQAYRGIFRVYVVIGQEMLCYWTRMNVSCHRSNVICRDRGRHKTKMYVVCCASNVVCRRWDVICRNSAAMYWAPHLYITTCATFILIISCNNKQTVQTQHYFTIVTIILHKLILKGMSMILFNKNDYE